MALGTSAVGTMADDGTGRSFSTKGVRYDGATSYLQYLIDRIFNNFSTVISKKSFATM